jgi:hypothetical protein
MVVNSLAAHWLRWIFTCLALTGLAFLGGCGGGSGAPNNPFKPVPPAPAAVSIIPPSIVAFSNTPTSLTITGGVAPFLVASNNPAILPVAQLNTTGTIVLLPATVVTDTAVIITVQDSIGQVGTATVTVKAAPIFNTLTITPASAACGANSVCSGQSATAKVTVTGPGGAGIPNRQVRFDVVSGAFSIHSTDPANPFVSTLTVVSDQFGVAQVILQAAASVPTQPAQLRATDVTTGFQQTAQFTIVQTINGSAVLSIVPSDITFLGPDTLTCSTNFRGDYYIFGGTPPYQVSASPPGVVFLQGAPVAKEGGFFTVISNGTCTASSGIVLIVVDASGLQTTATFHNLPGTTPPTPPTPPSALVLSPTSYTMAGGCSAATQFTFLVTGGTPPYNVSSSPNAQAGGGLTTPNPTSLNGTGVFTVNWNGLNPTGTAFVIAVDSGAPQQTVTGQVTCNP